MLGNPTVRKADMKIDKKHKTFFVRYHQLRDRDTGRVAV
jgi:hypothetical protein